MRAVVVDDFTTPEALRVRETDAPSLAENEVRIEVRAAGCNFSDVLMLKGEYQVQPCRLRFPCPTNPFLTRRQAEH